VQRSQPGPGHTKPALPTREPHKGATSLLLPRGASMILDASRSLISTALIRVLTMMRWTLPSSQSARTSCVYSGFSQSLARQQSRADPRSRTLAHLRFHLHSSLGMKRGSFGERPHETPHRQNNGTWCTGMLGGCWGEFGAFDRKNDDRTRPGQRRRQCCAYLTK